MVSPADLTASLVISPPCVEEKHMHDVTRHDLVVGTPASSEDPHQDVLQSRALSDDQSAAIGRMYRSHVEAARSAAYAIVRDQRLAEELAQTGIARLIHSVTRVAQPVPFPADDDAFRARWIVIVENLARDCVRRAGAQAERPAHAFWGEPEQVVPSGRKVAERPLNFDVGPDSQFWNRAEDDDAPRQPVRSECGLHYYPRHDRNQMLDRLESLLWWEIGNLPHMQQEVLRLAWAEGLSRAEIAEALQIAPATVGTHTKRAYAALRNALLKQRYFPPHSIDAELHEIFVAMNDRAKAARARARRPVTSGHPATDGSLARSGEAS